MEVPELRLQGSAIFTVLAELYSNALEHGVLGLDSTLKSSATGFSTYYEKKESALSELAGGFVRFDFSAQVIDRTGIFRIQVSDSGKGFDFSEHLNGGTESGGGYHGRGMTLLRQLCSELNYLGKGNQVEAIFQWKEKNE